MYTRMFNLFHTWWKYGVVPLRPDLGFNVFNSNVLIDSTTLHHKIMFTKWFTVLARICGSNEMHLIFISTKNNKPYIGSIHFRQSCSYLGSALYHDTIVKFSSQFWKFVCLACSWKLDWHTFLVKTRHHLQQDASI